jgi:nitrite reductase/ring-hydroxylating ferredoxin subunit
MTWWCGCSFMARKAGKRRDGTDSSPGLLFLGGGFPARDREHLLSGNYQALDVLGDSVLVVRSRDTKLAAHYNVCRHRGSCLVPEGARGRFTGTIRCPYHSWTYALDGSLRAT